MSPLEKKFQNNGAKINTHFIVMQVGPVPSCIWFLWVIEIRPERVSRQNY